MKAKRLSQIAKFVLLMDNLSQLLKTHLPNAIFVISVVLRAQTDL